MCRASKQKEESHPEDHLDLINYGKLKRGRLFPVLLSLLAQHFYHQKRFKSPSRTDDRASSCDLEKSSPTSTSSSKSNVKEKNIPDDLSHIAAAITEGMNA